MEVRRGKCFCSEQEIKDALDRFVDFCRERGLKFSGIYAIPRGGLSPGVYLSHRLNLPWLAAHQKGALIVDDIADTGRTLVPFEGKFYIFTIFYHKQSLVVPDYWVYEKKDAWIVFPWEGDDG